MAQLWIRSPESARLSGSATSFDPVLQWPIAVADVGPQLIQAGFPELNPDARLLTLAAERRQKKLPETCWERPWEEAPIGKKGPRWASVVRKEAEDKSPEKASMVHDKHFPNGSFLRLHTRSKAAHGGGNKVLLAGAAAFPFHLARLTTVSFCATQSAKDTGDKGMTVLHYAVAAGRTAGSSVE